MARPKEEIEIVAIASSLYRITASRGTPSRPYKRTNGRHAYFLVGVRGNVLFHGPNRVPFYKQHADFFGEHGGIGLQALTHGGDASKASAHVEKTWGAPVWVNQWELAQARAGTGLAIEKGFQNDEPLAPGVDGIHLPGHAVGMTAFRCRLDEGSFLICGHAIRPMPTRNNWAMYTGGPLVEAGLRSLARLRDLKVDFLCPDQTRWGLKPPLPFGADERAAITGSVEAYLAKKHGLASR